MSTKQTRRSVSISGAVYDRLKAHCVKESVSMSGLVEELLRGRLDMEQRETVRKLETRSNNHVEVVRTVASATVHPKAKPKNGTARPAPTADAAPRTYGLTKKQLAERRVKISEADERRAGNIFTF